MATFSVTWTAGRTVYAVAQRNSDSYYWNTTTSAYVASGSQSDLDIPHTASGTTYTATVPALDNVEHSIRWYDQAGGSPSSTADTEFAEDLTYSVALSGTALTSTSIVKEYLGITGTDDDAKLDTLVANVTQAAKTWLDRDIVSTDYHEYRSGDGNWFIRLREYPVTAVTRVAYGPDCAMLITNSSTANQRATVQLSDEQITLTRIASGVTTTTAILIETHLTIASLVSAINAISGGWSASSVSPYNLWPSSDLKTIQGAVSAIPGPAEFYLYPNEFTSWRLDDSAGLIHGHLPCGFNNLRIDYTAGYSTIPADLQQGVTMAVAQLYNLSRSDTTLKSEKIGDYSYVSAMMINFDDPVFSSARALLEPYRRKGMF